MAPELIIDLRNHGPSPETAIALVGQPIIWINNGTTTQTVTGGESHYSIYLPIINQDISLPVSQFPLKKISRTLDYVNFESGIILPGERFTFSFDTPGVYPYYSQYDPQNVVGSVVVVEFTT